VLVWWKVYMFGCLGLMHRPLPLAVFRSSWSVSGNRRLSSFWIRLANRTMVCLCVHACMCASYYKYTGTALSCWESFTWLLFMWGCGCYSCVVVAAIHVWLWLIEGGRGYKEAFCAPDSSVQYEALLKVVEAREDPQTSTQCFVLRFHVIQESVNHGYIGFERI